MPKTESETEVEKLDIKSYLLAVPGDLTKKELALLKNNATQEQALDILERVIETNKENMRKSNEKAQLLLKEQEQSRKLQEALDLRELLEYGRGPLSGNGGGGDGFM